MEKVKDLILFILITVLLGASAYSIQEISNIVEGRRNVEIKIVNVKEKEKGIFSVIQNGVEKKIVSLPYGRIKY
jgi:hypothetical protein